MNDFNVKYNPYEIEEKVISRGLSPEDQLSVKKLVSSIKTRQKYIILGKSSKARKETYVC